MEGLSDARSVRGTSFSVWRVILTGIVRFPLTATRLFDICRLQTTVTTNAVPAHAFLLSYMCQACHGDERAAVAQLRCKGTSWSDFMHLLSRRSHHFKPSNLTLLIRYQRGLGKLGQLAPILLQGVYGRTAAGRDNISFGSHCPRRSYKEWPSQGEGRSTQAAEHA